MEFLYQFLAKETTAYIFSGLIVLYFIYQVRQYKIKLNPIKKSLIIVNKYISKYKDEQSFRNSYEDFSKEILKEKFLNHQWHEFSETLIIQNDGIYNISDAEEFFSCDQIFGNNIHMAHFSQLPNILTGFGILGTFLGLLGGISSVSGNLTETGISGLLNGASVAFMTSIAGLLCSLIFSFIQKNGFRSFEQEQIKWTFSLDSRLKRLNQETIAFETLESQKKMTSLLEQFASNETPKQTSELSALTEIINILKDTGIETKSNLKKLNTALIGETDTSISSQLIKLRNQVTENYSEHEKQNNLLDKIQLSLIGNEETSLLTQLEKLRSQITDTYKEQKEHKVFLESINNSISSDAETSLLTQIQKLRTEQNDNNNSLKDKFDEFGEILKKNNTEALVEVMKNTTEAFNKQMSELIERLVQENFKELNKSVQNLNDWQKENKEMIATLTEQFIKVSNNFTIASTSIKEITENTSKLTNENSHLSKLILELQKIMIDDTKFQEIVNKLTGTIDILKENTETFDETTNKLNEWILNENNFKQSVDVLIVRLEEIEKIKDINGEFWSNTKTQLEEGVSLISNASKELRNNLDDISEEFTGQLNQTLTSLDELIQRLMEKSEGKYKIQQRSNKNIKDDDIPF